MFRQVTEAIKEQARRGVLFAFLIEMVPGMAHSRRSTGLGELSYYERWMTELQTDLPNFYICDWNMQSADYLPHHRERLYTVGIRRDALGTEFLVPPARQSFSGSAYTISYTRVCLRIVRSIFLASREQI